MAKNRPLHSKIEKIYLNGVRQTTDTNCGPARLILVAHAFGKNKIKFRHIPKFTRWLSKTASQSHGMILTELHFLCEAVYGKNFEVQIRRAYKENYEDFLHDLKRIRKDEIAIIMNFNQDHLLHRPYKNDREANAHFSPVINFDGKKITVADVDKNIKAPYTVSPKQAFASMAQAHYIFGYPRGWLTVRKR